MGRAAYFTNEWGLPPTAREEAEQRKHEDHDEDDPENAHAFTCLLRLIVDLAEEISARQERKPQAFRYAVTRALTAVTQKSPCTGQ